MRLRLAVVLLAATAINPAFAGDIAANSHIDAVTIYPFGAEVERVADATLSAGETTLIFDGLPGELDPATLRVEGVGGAGIEIGSVDSKLVAVPSTATEADRKAVEDKIEALRDERGRLDQVITDAEYQRTLLQQLAGNAFAPPSKPADARPFNPQDLTNLVDLVGGKLQDVSKLTFESKIRQRSIDKQIADVQAQLDQMAPRDEQRFRVSVHLASSATASGSFHLKYRIANARWQPVYDARLTSPAMDGKARIDLVQRAEVMQSTTESWDGVKLTLSTARPLGATTAPDLNPYAIIAYGGGDAESSTAARDVAGMLAKKSAAPVASPPSLSESGGEADAPAPEQQAIAGMAGFQALYAIPGAVTVDNTGTAKAVQIGKVTLDAALSAKAVPKLDPSAYLTASFTLGGDTPLLPGQVMLYRDGVFMGQGVLPLLAPGEDTKLGFGVDDLIKVKRAEVKRLAGEEGFLTTSNVETRAYDITVKNLHDFAVPVTILDQMPFSTDEKVTVDILPGMTPASETDFEKKRGVLAWNIALPPTGEDTVKHGFKVTWPKEATMSPLVN
ncbi:mucoidy inhibitor MuiA family protein [Aestuariivirga sp.]|uniref:mucoidy inhibitor MuiA family protein n=1 Tax=Aestuariivirga sp. TaxID=2650926 RepID=UPI0039E6B33E